jgi:TDG/mug DNA glycosylase family protein
MPALQIAKRTEMKKIKDVIAPGLQVLFCGINPGLYSAAVGHNFARPGNRFWPALFAAGFTDRLLKPSEERKLLQLGCGITNIVERPTASAAELSKAELQEGAHRVMKKVLRYHPSCLAVVGISAYRVAFEKPQASLGLQTERLGDCLIWVLPNPSGLNAHYQLPEIAEQLRALRRHVLSLPPLQCCGE